MEPWSTSFDTGLPEVDEAHRALYAKTEAAAEAVERGVREEVVAALAAVLSASEDHFVAEERLMVESAFPNLRAHRAAHQAFLVEARQLAAELDARGLSPLFRLWFGSRFVSWLRFHFRGLDPEFYRHHRAWLERQAADAEAALIAAGGPGAAGAGKPG